MVKNCPVAGINTGSMFMKISELIDLLKTYQRDYGDLEVKKEILKKDVNGDFESSFVKLDSVQIRLPHNEEMVVWF